MMRAGTFKHFIGGTMLIWALVSSPSSSAALGEKPKVYGKRVAIGHKFVRFDTTCMVLGATMSSGDFFDSLERISRSNGSQFRKGGVIHAFYPSDVLVEIEVEVIGCPATHDPKAPKTTTLNRPLRFQVHWKTGSQMRQANGLSVDRYRPPMKEGGFVQVYRLRFHAKDVPLSSHLTIAVLLEGGREITSFTVRM